MLRQIAENVAAKETEILRAQVCQRCPENIRSRALQPEMDLSGRQNFRLYASVDDHRITHAPSLFARHSRHRTTRSSE
jgi:hypothetical protein